MRITFNRVEIEGLIAEVKEIERLDNWLIESLLDLSPGEDGNDRRYYSRDDALELMEELTLLQPAENSYLLALHKQLVEELPKEYTEPPFLCRWGIHKWLNITPYYWAIPQRACSRCPATQVFIEEYASREGIWEPDSR